MKNLVYSIKIGFVFLGSLSILFISATVSAIDDPDGTDNDTIVGNALKVGGGPRIIYVSPRYNNNIYSYPAISETTGINKPDTLAQARNSFLGPLMNSLEGKIGYISRAYNQAIFGYSPILIPDPVLNLPEVDISAMEPVLSDDETQRSLPDSQILYVSRAYNQAIYGYAKP